MTLPPEYAPDIIRNNRLHVVAEQTPIAQQTIKQALTLLESQLREPGMSFTSSSSVQDWLRLHMILFEHEEFTLFWLDNQNRLITHETLFKGTINSTEFHPREVVKSRLKRMKHNAAAAVLATPLD